MLNACKCFSTHSEALSSTNIAAITHDIKTLFSPVLDKHSQDNSISSQDQLYISTVIV